MSLPQKFLDAIAEGQAEIRRKAEAAARAEEERIRREADNARYCRERATRWVAEEFPAILTKLVAEGKTEYQVDDAYKVKALEAEGFVVKRSRWIEASPEDRADGWPGYPAHEVWIIGWHS